MNTSNIKKVAPQARREFIHAVAKRLKELGIHSDSEIAECSQQGELLNIEGRHFSAAIKTLRDRLVSKVKTLGFESLVENVAYTWFNRLCAIRYMELHDYLDHGLRVLSHPTNPNTFEILEHAQNIAEDLGLNRDRIIELKLAGNKDETLYRELLIGQCHQLHKAMPFLFEALDDETELLMPDNLTRTDSILRTLVNDIPEEDWQQVEVIGWLYQFYISEKKDQVIGKVVKSEDIPAATQLFTPNWIVKYLVQNSVGRQWLQTYPDSSIKSKMEYYIEPAKQSDEVNAQLKAITPDSIEPESIKVLDPACGSGHILVEAYQVLKAIYEEHGYRSRDIPKLILENNLFGLDIDDRAAQLAGFALMMLARADDRRIFTRDITLNVLSIQESSSVDLELIWRDLEIDDAELYDIVQDIWTRFEQGKTFGSLVDIPAHYEKSLTTLLNRLNDLEINGGFLQKPVATSLKPMIQQAWILAQRYDAVMANPPYMGSKGMNAELKKFAKDNYPNAKSDLFAIFMEHAFNLLKDTGFNAQINMQSWMFLSSYEKMRKWLLDTKTFITMAHLGARAFSQISGEVVQTTAWVLNKKHIDRYQPVFFRLIEGNEKEKQQALLKQKNRFDNTQQDDFKKIPGSPIAYWLSNKVFDTIETSMSASDIASSRAGMTSGDNDRFTRQWHEVSYEKIKLDAKNWNDAISSTYKWFPYNKGGAYKKWFGNITLVIRYDSMSRDILKNTGNKCASEDCYFKEGLTWTDLTSGRLGARYLTIGAIFDIAGHCAFPVIEDGHLLSLGMLNTPFINDLSKVINATMHFQPGDFRKLPFPKNIDKRSVITIIKECISLSEKDWCASEISWGFSKNSLINDQYESHNILASIYNYWENLNKKTIAKVKHLEEDNNRLFIEAYGLQDELNSEVPIEQITLTVNPKYRYGGKGTDEELANRFQSDTLSELISYAVGCMMGRYSLDRKGLVYAKEGNEGFANLVTEGAYKTFPADDDGIIPLTDQDWFADDATNRFREFVRIVWGEEHLQENLDFVAESLCLYAIKPKRGESSLETIRRYLSNQFYKDHLKTYKKRPIYWLFSSGKQKAFECLVYLHRYNEGTLARMRTEYVTPLLGKYDAYSEQLQKQIDDVSSTAEANRLKKEQTTLQKKQNELREFDDKLKHYADRRISLDLDDGVKVNYGKFGDLLADVKAVTGKMPQSVS